LLNSRMRIILLFLILYILSPAHGEVSETMMQTCSTSLLPSQNGIYWSCEKDEPTLGDTCRVECENDLVVEKEKLLVCTMQGWGPKQSDGGLGDIPACLPNACPSLMEKKIQHGEWECTDHNTTRSCKNYRVGEVCVLKCKGDYKASLGHVSVCTGEGWVPSAENLRCYGCEMPENPPNGKWKCDVMNSGKTVCFLKCNEKFALKGSHMVECDSKDGFFDPEPSKSGCAATDRADFTAVLTPTYRESADAEDPLGDPSKVGYGKMKDVYVTPEEDEKPVPVNREDFFHHAWEGKPILIKDPDSDDELKEVGRKEFESILYKYFNCKDHGRNVTIEEDIL